MAVCFLGSGANKKARRRRMNQVRLLSQDHHISIPQSAESHACMD